jgi:hypothetical protein
VLSIELQMLHAVPTDLKHGPLASISAYQECKVNLFKDIGASGSRVVG